MTQDATPDALPWRWRVVVAIAWLGALALLGFTLAHWAWRWLGPAPVVLPLAATGGDFAARIAAARLFGTAPPASAVASSGASVGPSELRLLGVFAQRDGGGYALFRGGARGPLLVAAGQDVSAGVHLDAVRPDGVTLTEGGVRRDIVLRPASPTDRTRATPAAAVKPTSACAVPAGFAGPVLRVNAELLDGMMQTPDAWKALVEPAAGALVVRDQSGFAGMLGLKNGDRVERANGIALAIPADIPSTVLQPLTRSQPVWLAGTRDGKAQQWLYLNAGACPG